MSKEKDKNPDSIYYPRYIAWGRDPRYLKMKRKLGHEGAGILSELLDFLREQDQYSASVETIDDIAYLIHADADKLRSIINEFELFRVEDGLFSSTWLTAALKPLDEKRIKLQEAGRRGGEQSRKGKRNPVMDDQPEATLKPPLTDAEATIKPGEGHAEASRVEESIVEKRKKNKSKEEDILNNPFPDDFLQDWQEWKDYKLREHRFRYKTIKTEQEAINDLFEISNKDPGQAREIIRKSIVNGYKGLFSLKNQNNGNNGSSIAPASSRNAGTSEERVNAAASW